jgi:hypothetical protein
MPRTQIANLPYPALSDYPNGPDQMFQLASAVEPKLVNWYSSSSDRRAKLGAPIRGQLTWRDDDRIFEYWNGSAWTGVDRTAVIAKIGQASDATDRTMTTNESGARAKSTVKLTNSSNTYRMFCQFSWDTQDRNVVIRHYISIGSHYTSHRAHTAFTGAGNIRSFSGMFPCRTGYLGFNSSVTVSTWLTYERSSGSGRVSFTFGSTDFQVIGIQTSS